MQRSIKGFFKMIATSLEEIKQSQQNIEKRQTVIEKSQLRMEEKIDEIHQNIAKLITSVDEIKGTVSNEDEKLFLMSKQLDRFEKYIKEGNEELTDDYTELSKRIIENWDDLEELSKKFIPVAEYLYYKLQNTPDADFSPVVLQYCRALENEFLRKVFINYTIQLIEKKDKEIHTFLMDDLKGENVRLFATKIKSAVKSKSPDYTLGQMNRILSMLSNKKIVRNSPLLQDFYLYLENKYNVEALLNRDYINMINTIVREYRNPSAHPEYLNLKVAEQCKSIIPEKIDYFLNTRSVVKE